MACGVCGTTGHNSRTCPEVGTSNRSPLKAQSSGPSTLSTRQSCTVCGSVGHNSRTCEKGEAKRPPSPRPGNSGRKSKEDIANGKRSFSTNAASLPIDDIRDLVSTIREIKEGAKKGTVNNGAVERKGQLNSGNNETGDEKKAEARPSSSKGKVTTVKSPENAVKNSDGPTRSNKSSKAPLGINWLNSEALERLENGPTNGDGPGYIYMYRDSDSKAVGDKNTKLLYKIGRSKNLPQKRVREQERKNKAEYDIVFSVETPYNVMTEGVIHKQLEAYHSPKESGDGRTEWFRGMRDYFEETINKAVREVKFAFPEEE